ncbi:VOC family protein [Pararhizobium sp.]|uniref:VOC family protein n=1 Tax=Pararhizobium sp. TaxID=1977563 RepID=UPI00272567FC|nr:VOC family protein [Pararhizobium sp.]MDO9418858.1 VOC family protein [Pararhizobium sp.]
MIASQRTARPLDHLVLPVATLAVARIRLSQLGFTVAADAQHPFGTENACVFFADKTYLEPLSVASQEACDAACLAGNMFVARDRAFRFRRGEEGLSAIVLGTSDALADHDAFKASGVSGGDIVEFSRSMVLPDGTTGTGSFRLAFAADLRSPDFFFFSCQRIQSLPSDRAALERHDNGVLGLSNVSLSEPNPSDFQGFIEEAVDGAAVSLPSTGMEIVTANGVRIAVLNPAGMLENFGKRTSTHARGLRGRAVTFKVGDLAMTERLFAANGIDYIRQNERLLVPEAPGQGVIFAFGE